MEPEKNTQPTPVESKSKVVQTYAEDMAQAIGTEGGLVKKIIHGEEEHEAEKMNLSPESKQNKLFMILGIFLLVIGIVVLGLLFLKKEEASVTVEKPFTPIIFNDKTAFPEIAGLSRDEIIQTILSQINSTQVKQGGVEGVYLTENVRPIGLRRFLSLIKSNFIPSDNKLLVDDNFLMGVVNTGVETESKARDGFFILIKVRSSADIFSSLRAWENKMLTDLHSFVGVEVNSETNYLFTKDFEDGIAENKNARILYDKEGKIVLMYVYADDNSVIITNSQPAVHEIVLRLASSQKTQ